MDNIDQTINNLNEGIDTPITSSDNTPKVKQPSIQSTPGPFDLSKEDLKTQVVDNITSPQFGLLSNLGASLTYGHEVSSEYGRQHVLVDTIKEDYWKVRNNNLVDPSLYNTVTQDLNYDPEQSKYQGYLNFVRDNPETIIQLQKDHPELGLKSYSQIHDDLLNRFATDTQNMNKVSQDTSFIGGLGRFLGGAIGFASDPVGMAATLAPIARISASALRTFATMGAQGALTVAGAELVNKPGEVAVRQALGENVSSEQALTESTTNVVAGGLTIGALGVLGKKLGDLLGHDLKPSTKQQVVDAQNVVNDSEYLLKSKVADVSQEVHDQAVAKAAVDISNNKDVDLSNIIPGEVKPEQIKYEPEQVDELMKNIEDPRVLDTTFNDIHEQLKTQDIKFTTIDDLGYEHEVSALKHFNEIADDKVAQREIANCLLTGGISNAD